MKIKYQAQKKNGAYKAHRNYFPFPGEIELGKSNQQRTFQRLPNCDTHLMNINIDYYYLRSVVGMLEALIWRIFQL